jgi:AcrR family transcriptional regulator
VAENELKGQARVGAERRSAIVDAAIEVYAQRGYRGSALADVAERVGVTPAGILYHFGTKEDLLLAVIAERDRRASEELTDMPIAGGLESLRGIIRFAEMSERERGLTALHTVLTVESFDPDAPTHAYFHHRSRVLRDWGERTLLAAQKKEEIRADVDCRAKAQQLVAFLEGAAVLWLSDDSLSLVALYQEYLDSLIASIQIRRVGDDKT